MRRVLRLLVASLLFLFLLPPAIMAQERTITGTVLADDNKTPLSGVTVTVKGTQRKTQTDANGNFTIRINAGETLQFSYVGREFRELKPDGNTVSITLKSAESTLEEVVVTAMDIKRNPRELGYSAQKVGGNEVAQTQRENFLNGLAGRVAGLTVNPTGGQAGASTAIVLRGFNSMALDNQPLFVIDGVIVDNSTVNETSGSNTGLGLVENSARNVNQTSNRSGDYTNRIADLNPNDIESYTILKGPEATALYGSQASSGAIIITTKKGKTNGQFSLNYDNAFRVSSLTRFPDYTTKWSPGFNGQPGENFYFFGPAYSNPQGGYNNVEAFFKKGFAQSHNLSGDWGNKTTSFRASGSFFDQSGVVPENKYQRITGRISNNTKIGKYIEITPSITYTRATNDRPKRGAGSYMLNLLLWPRDYDVRDYMNADGGKQTLFFANPNDEIDNPFFSVYNNKGYDLTNRYVGTFGINITPFEWLRISGRFGYDHFNTEGWSFYHPLSSILSKGTGGQQDNYFTRYNGYNHTITATANKKFGKFGARLLVGTMWQDYKREMYSMYGTNIVDSVNSAGQMVKNGQVVSMADIAAWMGDSTRTRPSTRQYLNRALKNPGDYNYVLNRQLAYFGEASISYDNKIFLTYSHRFETSSIFPKDYRNYNYPAGSLSMIMSDIIPGIKNNFLTYWKLRTSLASTARSSAPYANQSVFTNSLSSGNGYYYGFTNNNFFLEPEIQQTYEIGTELRLFKSRLGLEVTYYNTLNKKQIAENFRASYGTGYVLNTINVGSTRNKGVEVSVDFNAVNTRDLRWDMRFNFNKMWNRVVSLPDNVPEFYISDTWVYNNARGGLVVGGPTTAITSFGYARNNAGQILIDPASGLPVIDQTFKVHGDRNPDFVLGWQNTLRSGNWGLSFLWDLRIGGDVFNATDMYLTSRGVGARTDDRLTPRVITGVLKDGLENTNNPTANTIVVIPAYNDQYYSRSGGATGMPEEEFIEHNINWFRLRDITLTYNFSSSALARWKFFKSFGLFVTGNDLLLFSNYSGADPAVSANSAGTRGVGGWGFDYGNIATPISFNFGLRAGF